MKTVRFFFYTLVISALTWSCGNSDPEFERPPVPTVTPALIYVEEGSTADARVLDAKDVVITENSRPDLFDARLNGHVVTVSGLSAGEGVLTLLADDTRLTLTVKVTPRDVDDSYDFSPELADCRTRFTSDRLTMVYDDNPGIIVTRRSDGLIEMRDLCSGDHIAFNPAGDTEGPLEQAALTVNGVATPLESCTLQRRCENGDRWYSMRRRGAAAHTVLVLTSL